MSFFVLEIIILAYYTHFMENKDIPFNGSIFL